MHKCAHGHRSVHPTDPCLSSGTSLPRHETRGPVAGPLLHPPFDSTSKDPSHPCPSSPCGLKQQTATISIRCHAHERTGSIVIELSAGCVLESDFGPPRSGQVRCHWQYTVLRLVAPLDEDGHFGTLRLTLSRLVQLLAIPGLDQPRRLTSPPAPLAYAAPPGRSNSGSKGAPAPSSGALGTSGSKGLG
jgi:hypothetical protein